MSNVYLDKIAKILRVTKKDLAEYVGGLEKITGKINVLEKIFFENEKLAEEKLHALGVTHEATASEVYDALISKVEADDLQLLNQVGHTSLRGFEAAQALVNFVRKIHKPGKGFFLKKEKARQLLRAEPPRKIMAALGYERIEDLIEKEDLLEIYSALRFLEDTEWQNKIFFKQYENLKPEDFEERNIELKALNEKWARAAEKFVRKKHHNISHLKELGVVFVIPLFLGISGETLRAFSLLFHYLYEVQYYSELFKKFARHHHATFAVNVISVLRGDVIEKRLPPVVKEAQRPRILVIQRYLAKDDENDWRLLEPHINPEALHWQRAEEDIAKISKNFEFWKDIDWVGDFFKTEVGVEILVSFDLVDTVMSLVKEKELAKYLYHQQEALWNKIFIEFFGLDKLEQLSKDNIVRGWFEV